MEEKDFKDLLEYHGYPVINENEGVIDNKIFTIPPQEDHIWRELITLLNVNDVPKNIFPNISRYKEYTLVSFVVLELEDRTNQEDLNFLEDVFNNSYL